MALAATLAVAACGSTTSTAGNGTATPSGLTACTSNLTAPAPTRATATAAGVSGKLTIDGSTALAPLFSQLATSFDAANGTQTTVTPNGSGTGLHDVDAGAVLIGMSDVFALEKATTAGQYSELVDHQVAVIPFTVVTNNDLKGKVNNLTSAQITQIFTGQVTNWQQLGGPTEPITTVGRPSSSGTRATFDKYVLGGATETPSQPLTQDTSGAVVSAVAATPGSIGYLAASYVVAQGAGQTAPICIDGFDAQAKNINAGSYKFWSIEHAYTKGSASGDAKAFLQFAESSDVQTKDVPSLGFLQITTVAASAIQSHTPSGAPAPESLSS
jgi:phosphate transport system substrate-binding protein